MGKKTKKIKNFFKEFERVIDGLIIFIFRELLLKTGKEIYDLISVFIPFLLRTLLPFMAILSLSWGMVMHPSYFMKTGGLSIIILVIFTIFISAKYMIEERVCEINRYKNKKEITVGDEEVKNNRIRYKSFYYRVKKKIKEIIEENNSLYIIFFAIPMHAYAIYVYIYSPKYFLNFFAKSYYTIIDFVLLKPSKYLLDNIFGIYQIFENMVVDIYYYVMNYIKSIDISLLGVLKAVFALFAIILSLALFIIIFHHAKNILMKNYRE